MTLFLGLVRNLHFALLRQVEKMQFLALIRDHPSRELTKKLFVPILKNVINAIKGINLQNGFKSCGLHSWNPDAIDLKKYLGRN